MIKKKKKHFRDLFQFPWNDAIMFFRFHSSVAWWKPAASPCIVQCHQIPSHFESLQSFITLSVCLFTAFFLTFSVVPDFCVYFSRFAWKDTPSLLSIVLSFYILANCSLQCLTLLLKPSVSELPFLLLFYPKFLFHPLPWFSCSPTSLQPVPILSSLCASLFHSLFLFSCLDLSFS